MGEIIRLIEKDGKKAVSAKELYSYLGFASQHWAKWYTKNITDNEFALESDDWTELPLSGRTPDFALSLNFAKKLCMMARTDKGEEARNYFIQCEQAAKGAMAYRLPITYAEALRQLADETEAKEKIQKELESAKPKIDFFNQVADSKDAIDMGSVAKVLNNGMGRNKIFEFLRSEGILMHNNLPYQQYQDMGWFRVIEQKYTKPDSSTHISTKTLVYQKGLQAIQKRILKAGEKNLPTL